MILEKDPSWLGVSAVSFEELSSLGIRDYFDERGQIISSRLPDLYRQVGDVVTGDFSIAQGSLRGIRTLAQLDREKNHGVLTENFKLFALGFFLKSEVLDQVNIHAMAPF